MILDKKDLEAKADAVVGKLNDYLDAGKKVFATCSFQSQSLPLLHMISRVERDIPVYYTNTGFLFAETIRFAEQVSRDLGINVIALRPEVSKIKQLDRAGRFLYDVTKFVNRVSTTPAFNVSGWNWSGELGEFMFGKCC